MKILVLLMLLFFHNICATYLCDECDCFPPDKPTQVFCDKSGPDDAQNITIFSELFTTNLNLLSIHGYNTVVLSKESVHTLLPITVLIYNTRNLTLHRSVFSKIQSLTIAHVEYLQLKEFALTDLSAYIVRLQHIKHLIIETNAVQIFYDLQYFELKNVNNLQVYEKSIAVSENETKFKMINCSVKLLPENSIKIFTAMANIDHCFFEELFPYSINITAISEINITNNHFQNINETSVILNSQTTYVTSNYFKTLPAKSLNSMSERSFLNFINNTLYDTDLGGIMLYPESNTFKFVGNMINCSCLPTITSILMPKEVFPIFPVLNEMFQDNFCLTECKKTLMDFSNHLVKGQICRNNKTVLTSNDLCNLTQIVFSSTETSESKISVLSRGHSFVPNFCSSLYLCYVYFMLKVFL